ncbi:hypothetical protein [Caldimonas sp. KR1-144]|uniref:hypothetical protein n=1 Tax=Caldimonas sp. KR1-144 TaxID=3400911 RepID=UPI003C0277FD
MGIAAVFPRRPQGASPATGTRAQLCRRFVRRQALKAAGVSALPVAGVDLFVNGKLLASTLESINLAYGLSAEQVARLPAPQRSQVEALAREIGSYLVGRALTQTLMIGAMRAIGVRLGAQQAAKLVPVAGQIASGAISGWLFKRLCERHIAHCESIAQALPQLPAPADTWQVLDA